MSGDTIFRLVEYENWCNQRAMEFLARLDDAELRRDFGFGLRTLHRTMFHVADVLQGWSRCVAPKIEAPQWLTYRDDIPLTEIRELLSTAGARWLAAAQASHEQGLLARDGRLNHVFHLVTHGTHHRGQLLSMLTLLGHDHPFEGGDFGGWSLRPNGGA